MGSGRNAFLILASSALVAAGAAASSGAPAPGRSVPQLVLYTYDSFVAKGGPGPEIFPIFERRCGCRIRALPSGDGGQILTRLQLDAERGSHVAQLVVGLDLPTWQRASRWLEPLGDQSPRGRSALVSVVRREVDRQGAERSFMPYDYGYFAFMADLETLKKAGLPPPSRFADLMKPEWRRNLILEDPRTSTPGLAFLLFSEALGQEGFWNPARPAWLTLAPGWDGAYGLFLRGEAPLVWSYTTSQAYHEEHGDAAGAGRRYRAVVLDEGQPMQIEGAAMIRGGFASDPRLRGLAGRFLAFLISPEAQERLPRLNWMYPARGGVKLPASFEHLPRPKRVVRLPAKADEVSAALSRWTRAISSVK